MRKPRQTELQLDADGTPPFIDVGSSEFQSTINTIIRHGWTVTAMDVKGANYRLYVRPRRRYDHPQEVE